MNRWVAAVAVMAAVPFMAADFNTTANTRPAPVDPIDALNRQLAKDRGVKMSKVRTFTINGQEEHFWTEAVAAFRKGKIFAIDVTHDSDRRTWENRLQQITFEGRQYVRDEHLPNGKTWILRKDKEARPVLSADWIKLADPSMLKEVLATTEVKGPAGVYDGTRTILYQGTITFGRLYKAFPGFPFGRTEKPAREEADAKISWKLWLGEDQLVRRAWGSWSEPFSKKDDVHVSYVVDAHLTGWGIETNIEAPAAGDVMTL